MWQAGRGVVAQLYARLETLNDLDAGCPLPAAP
jgi:hypothetical protein